MATVWIPSLAQDLTGGQGCVSVPGATVREVIAALEERYPGIALRLCEEGRIRPGIAVIVDGEVSPQKMRHPLTDKSEVHFLPALSGG